MYKRQVLCRRRGDARLRAPFIRLQRVGSPVLRADSYMHNSEQRFCLFCKGPPRALDFRYGAGRRRNVFP